MASNKYITAHETNGESKSINIDHPPQECPQCHRGQRPVDVNAHFLPAIPKNGMQRLESIYRCTFADCEITFISYYLVAGDKGRFVRSLPEKFESRLWDETIGAISPEFVEIYDQASHAETSDLEKIAGPGYRKALEFLVKDWLIANNFDKPEKIRSKQLGQCIQEYIDEKHIKAIAARAAWLGNDESHYYKVWTDKDINDLKKLIELTANWINIHELSNAVIEDMPDKKTNEDKEVS